MDHGITLPSSNCPDCDTPMQRIEVRDATELSPKGQGAWRVDLAYRALGADASAFSGNIPPKGIIGGQICPKCGRVMLYGMHS